MAILVEYPRNSQPSALAMLIAVGAVCERFLVAKRIKTKGNRAIWMRRAWRGAVVAVAVLTAVTASAEDKGKPLGEKLFPRATPSPAKPPPLPKKVAPPKGDVSPAAKPKPRPRRARPTPVRPRKRSTAKAAPNATPKTPAIAITLEFGPKARQNNYCSRLRRIGFKVSCSTDPKLPPRRNLAIVRCRRVTNAMIEGLLRLLDIADLEIFDQRATSNPGDCDSPSAIYVMITH